MRGSRTLY